MGRICVAEGAAADSEAARWWVRVREATGRAFALALVTTLLAVSTDNAHAARWSHRLDRRVAATLDRVRRRAMAHIARFDDEDDVFGDVGGVIADALQMT